MIGLNQMKKLLIGGAFLSVFFPLFASAQLANVTNLIEEVGDIVDLLIPIVGALALLYFFWGLANFILASNSGDEPMKDKAKNTMIWGIVALFVMVSVWGLVEFVGEALGVDPEDNQSIPGVQR